MEKFSAIDLGISCAERGILVPESEASHQMTFSYNNRRQIHLYSGSFRNHHLRDCYVFFQPFQFPSSTFKQVPSTLSNHQIYWVWCLLLLILSFFQQEQLLVPFQHIMTNNTRRTFKLFEFCLILLHKSQLVRSYFFPSNQQREGS